MSQPRIALLGTGPWAERTHAPALAAHPDAAFSGVWGRRPEAASALAALHGTTAYAGGADGGPGEGGLDGLDALLAVSDAVAFALPPDIQAPLAARAAAAGCHLLMDKPVATTVPGARAVADAAKAAGVASLVFCTLRFAAGTAEWVDEQAAAGGWFTAHAYWFGALYGAGGEKSPYADSPWRREKGGLWDVGPHALSALLPVLGDVTAVTAVRSEPDLTHLVLTHASGVTSSAALSLSAPARGAGAGVELRGEHGTVTLPEGGADPAVAFGTAIDALLTAARTGEPHACDVRFGLRLTEILAEAEAQLTRA
ncbi:Gfo/Idh/MocA family oxidoreductase [Streptomyces sp. NBC_01498]|uniref:Gfo/Idh/MocA family protein n=1 Tax=Streptomyces sp. NBC_01498 TaxID=2975870 RepID=UPI002E7BF1B8|nr:Gfo/Idh/MocA family oxidoreductase [Streptomyces sp. NBC_01498]WTL27219.1 Gfo/Idh/MocA family oxidoreductase [Streptomyces sp. NBC_01498]